jgi:murein DD-endopeptidase MepM/ murein hydrolase activator NlpD
VSLGKLNQAPRKSSSGRLVPILMWGIAAVMVAFTVVVWSSRNTGDVPAAALPQAQTDPDPNVSNPPDVPKPSFAPDTAATVSRMARLHTQLPAEHPRYDVATYTIEQGDSLFAIAKTYNIKPESILFSNFDVLNDNPDEISIGLTLRIPPVDGIYYQWKEGDTVEEVAARYEADPNAILAFPGNRLDMTAPKIQKDQYVMIPGGTREFQTWVVATIWAPSSGAIRTISSQCEVQSWVLGSGVFIWPTTDRYLSGNDYWSGHLGIDIAASVGNPVYASDSGVVVFSGWNPRGYGYMVMIDHGNGFHTVYAHLSSVRASCGSGVSRGQVIGSAGSTGNSTGPHLHFEIRYFGTFVNPWSYLNPDICHYPKRSSFHTSAALW